MRVSISRTNYSWPDGPQGLRSRLADLVRTADDAGIDTVWVPDHLLLPALRDVEPVRGAA